MEVAELLSSKYIEPTFSVNFYQVSRPSSTNSDPFLHKIEKTKGLFCWKIVNEKLMKVNRDNFGILFDSESYIIQWVFDLKSKNAVILDEHLVYHWTGQKAKKGVSPLPPEIDEQCPVDRVVQWSEPVFFFRSFLKPVFAFSGHDGGFDENSPHLLIVRGEIVEEIHLYEVPCEKKSLRSRASFMLILPSKKLFIYWHGSQTSLEHRKNIVHIVQPQNALKEWRNSWSDFAVKEIDQSFTSDFFYSAVQGDSCFYPPLPVGIGEFSPKLFYLNSIGGSFQATEVEYALRAANVIAPFPFLQTHLYSSSQPALFLLDNNTDIWLWNGQKDCANGADNVQVDVASAQELAEKYVAQKEQIIGKKVSFHHVFANEEPLEFKNAFPFWQDR